jgi:hypothetical protein
MCYIYLKSLDTLFEEEIKDHCKCWYDMISYHSGGIPCHSTEDVGTRDCFGALLLQLIFNLIYKLKTP